MTRIKSVVVNGERVVVGVGYEGGPRHLDQRPA